MAYFNLSSYLYLYGLIYDMSLIILLTICTTRPFLPLISSHAACANVYRTYPLSRYLAVHYLMPQRVLSHIPSYSVGYKLLLRAFGTVCSLRLRPAFSTPLKLVGGSAPEPPAYLTTGGFP
jgi:hypothetical protein